MQRGAVHRTLRELTRRFEEAGIPYAVLGAMALGQHGLIRATLDIDILLAPEGLAKFKERYLGRGYVAAFPGAEKSFRAADTGVRIKMIATSIPVTVYPSRCASPTPRRLRSRLGAFG